MGNTSVMAYLHGDGAIKLEFSTSVDSIDITGEPIPADNRKKAEWLQDIALRYGGHEVEDGLEIPKAGYCIATSDHPFLDMSEGMEARLKDAQIMAGYVASDSYPSVYLELPHDETYQLEDAADLTIDELRNSARCRLSAMISGSFGVRRHQATYHDPMTGYHQVELVKKSVPSGGSRHPSELFLEIHASPVLSTGIWHFNSRRGELQRVSSAPLSKAPVSDADWIIGIAVASVVRRAMFRYRDPRSFRAILVDAGHAEAQLEAVANFCNWRYTSGVAIDFDFTTHIGLGKDEVPVLIRGLLEGWE